MESNQALINEDRRGYLNYEIVRGDSFNPEPVQFIFDGSEEDFDAPITLKMEIKKDGVIKKTLTQASGISITGGSIQWIVSAADMALWGAGIYTYDIQKTNGLDIKTILSGTITMKQDTTDSI